MSSKYTRADLLEIRPEAEIKRVESWLKTFAESADYTVFDWGGEFLPQFVMDMFPFNGGDEDWLVVTRMDSDCIPFWINHLDTCYTPDEYHLDGVYVYVGTHA